MLLKSKAICFTSFENNWCHNQNKFKIFKLLHLKTIFHTQKDKHFNLAQELSNNVISKLMGKDFWWLGFTCKPSWFPLINYNRSKISSFQLQPLEVNLLTTYYCTKCALLNPWGMCFDFGSKVFKLLYINNLATYSYGVFLFLR